MRNYADLHCHPGSAAYDENRMAQPGSPVSDKQPFHPWQIPPSNLKRQRKAKRAFGYTQCDLAKAVGSNTNLLFAALYPTEKGFFAGIKNGRNREEILRMMRAANEAKAKGEEDEVSEQLFQQLTPVEQKEFSKRTGVDELQSNKMNYSLDRIQLMQGGTYDYYQELMHEYTFWKSRDGLSTTTSEFRLAEGGPSQKWSGTYRLATPGTLAPLLQTTGEQIVVLTIEGMHAFGIGNYDWETVRDIDQTELLRRIDALKDPVLWPHRPFFITFSHHFANRLCGHAHSLPDFVSKILFDQRDMCDVGFTQNGMEAARALLGLNDLLAPDGTARILIDVKHMSAKGRKEFYAQIIQPFNQNPINGNNKIPVIASHVGFSGVAHLQALIDDRPRERDNFRKNGFSAWSINICIEDIIEVHNSRGLIGLSFDQRILGMEGGFMDFLKGKKRKRREATQAMMRTIEAIVTVPFVNDLSEPDLIWNEISIGTDFDGFIDPILGFSTIMDFPDFEDVLLESLNETKQQHPNWFTVFTPGQVTRKICYDNAHDFVLKHYR